MLLDPIGSGLLQATFTVRVAKLVACKVYDLKGEMDSDAVDMV